MAMLGAGRVGERIVKRIVGRVTGDEGSSLDRIFRKIVIEALVHGSSLICWDEGGRKGDVGWMYRMHRLVRLFVLTKLERGSDLWVEVYSVALGSVHEGVETELYNEGKSFGDLPDVFGNNHSEFVEHARALVDHHTLPAQGTEISDVSKVVDIHEYSGRTMEFTVKVEEVQVWERLADVLHHEQASNQRGSCSEVSPGTGKELGNGPSNPRT